MQTCFLGRYGKETGSDQFGAMIMATRGDNSTSNAQRIVVRLSNTEVHTNIVARASTHIIVHIFLCRFSTLAKHSALIAMQSTFRKMETWVNPMSNRLLFINRSAEPFIFKLVTTSPWRTMWSTISCMNLNFKPWDCPACILLSYN